MALPQSQIFSLIRLGKTLLSHPSQGSSDLRNLQPVIVIGNCSVQIWAILTVCDISDNNSAGTMKKRYSRLCSYKG